jgi:hypothetical protein
MEKENGRIGGVAMNPEEIRRRVKRDGTIKMWAFIFMMGGLVVLTFFPPRFEPPPRTFDEDCNNKPPCCNNEKHWNHKYDCER